MSLGQGNGIASRRPHVQSILIAQPALSSADLQVPEKRDDWDHCCWAPFKQREARVQRGADLTLHGSAGQGNPGVQAPGQQFILRYPEATDHKYRALPERRQERFPSRLLTGEPLQALLGFLLGGHQPLSERLGGTRVKPCTVGRAKSTCRFS